MKTARRDPLAAVKPLKLRGEAGSWRIWRGKMGAGGGPRTATHSKLQDHAQDCGRARFADRAQPTHAIGSQRATPPVPAKHAPGPSVHENRSGQLQYQAAAGGWRLSRGSERAPEGGGT